MPSIIFVKVLINDIDHFFFFSFLSLLMWTIYNFLMPTEIKYIFNPVHFVFILFITESLASPYLLYKLYTYILN